MFVQNLDELISSVKLIENGFKFDLKLLIVICLKVHLPNKQNGVESGSDVSIKMKS